MIPSNAILAGLALVAAGSIEHAQEMQVRTFDTLGHAAYDMSTGVVTRGQAQKSANLLECFDNTDTSGFFSTGSLVSSLGAPTEWLDWGIWCGTSGGTGSDIVGEFVFGYATTMLDPAFGGTGANARLRFYNGTVGNCLDSGTAKLPIASYSLNGLPASNTAGSVSGWIITVDLGGGNHFTSGGAGTPFGFSWTSRDDNGAGSWATGPLLCFAGDTLGSSSNPTVDPDSNGQVSLFDIYNIDVQFGSCIGTFTSSGASAGSAYLAMSTLDGGSIATASAVARNSATAPNPSNYVVTAPPVLGGTFAATDLSSNGGLGVFVVGYAAPLDFPTSTFGTILVDIGDFRGQLLPPLTPMFAAGATSFTIDIPDRLDLCGMSVSTQTVEFGAGIQMHNANDVVIGF